jgi:hypothetical protein
VTPLFERAHEAHDLGLGVNHDELVEILRDHLPQQQAVGIDHRPGKSYDT